MEDSKNLYSSSEAAIRKCFSKKMFLKIWQYSPEDTCVGVSF